jgi:hypothetical protein
MIECMFDHEVTSESSAILGRICAASRAENRAAAAQLGGIWDLFSHRLSRCSEETEDWAIDTMESVTAEVAAALRVSQAMAGSRLHYARTMRERLPKVGEVFAAGEIDFRTFQTIAYRTDLIEDTAILASVDAQLAANVARWPSMTQGRLSGAIDRIVVTADADAVRERKQKQDGREVWVGPAHGGVAEISATVFDIDAQAVNQRLSALAATVCGNDPRTHDQRRADALGALAAGADRLACRCGRTECSAAGKPGASAVVIHVIAEEAALRGVGSGWQVGADGLIPPEVIAELAHTARQTTLANPGDTPPEPGYTPSAALADFVRCRDLTCRWPGCDRPAYDCDLDHTIPHAQGGPTHAGNLKCLCRTHHLVKTFWGWREKQLADGTLILTSPSGQTYLSTPGSALLFPSLCHAVGGMPTLDTDINDTYCGDRTAMMPKRRRTRTQNRAARVTTERNHNRKRRLERQAAQRAAEQQRRPPPDDEPPPF